MTEKAKNDLRHYSGAAGIFILIIFLLLFLSFARNSSSQQRHFCDSDGNGGR